MAAITGAPLWSELCFGYRTFERAHYAYQKEWRILTRFPINTPEKAPAALTRALPAMRWMRAHGIAVLQFKREDVLALVVPPGESASGRVGLPTDYQDIDMSEATN